MSNRELAGVIVLGFLLVWFSGFYAGKKVCGDQPDKRGAIVKVWGGPSGGAVTTAEIDSVRPFVDYIGSLQWWAEVKMEQKFVRDWVDSLEAQPSDLEVRVGELERRVSRLERKEQQR